MPLCPKHLLQPRPPQNPRFVPTACAAQPKVLTNARVRRPSIFRNDFSSRTTFFRMRRSSSPLNTSELFLMLPSAKNVDGMRAKVRPALRPATGTPYLNGKPCHQARQAVSSQRSGLPSIRHGSAPSSPADAAAKAPSSPGMSQPESPPAQKQRSPSPKRSSGYMRPAKKKAE